MSLCDTLSPLWPLMFLEPLQHSDFKLLIYLLHYTQAAMHANKVGSQNTFIN